MSWSSTAYGNDDNMPTVVAGLGRCGSSMVMQMLTAGGLKLTGEAIPPLFEDLRVKGLPNDCEWLRELSEDNVLKLLAPYKFSPPEWFRCRAIWMERDLVQQAKSQHKMLATTRPGVPPMPVDMLCEAFKERTAISLRLIKEVTEGKFLRIQFEHVLVNPKGMAELLSVFLRRDFDLDKMARVVLKRSPECLEGLLEVHPEFIGREL